MIFKKTKINGLYIIEPELKEDERGYFARTFCKKEFFEATGQDFDIKQVNQSLTIKKGSIRGMHIRVEPNGEDKIIQCLEGAVYDVALDMRIGSLTFGQWEAVEISKKNGRMFFLPKGIAHGFQTLTDNCLMQYFMSEFYIPEYLSGYKYNDPAFNIKWPLPLTVISQKDNNWEFFKKNDK